MSSIINQAPLKLSKELESSVDKLGVQLSALSDSESLTVPAGFVTLQEQPVSEQPINFLSEVDEKILSSFNGEATSYLVFKEQFKFSSNPELIRMYREWTVKPQFSSRGEITAALVEFSGCLTLIGQLL